MGILDSIKNGLINHTNINWIKVSENDNIVPDKILYTLKQSNHIQLSNIYDLYRNLSPNKSNNKVVMNVIQLITLLDKIPHTPISISEFMDMLCDLFYNDVKMVLFNDFTEIYGFVHTNKYIDYYKLFLKYSIYYHYIRFNIDIINVNYKIFHKSEYKNKKKQLQYLNNIIYNIKGRSVSI
jgi:hypothetical protein